ncbi:MAG: N-acetylmuramoyl-L-alanine amidase, partial [Thermoleophilia bacterium]|nr:N-acetylmuramoyl-L-alanine amidase [Thermoleophilia bacterium]
MLSLTSIIARGRQAVAPVITSAPRATTALETSIAKVARHPATLATLTGGLVIGGIMSAHAYRTGRSDAGSDVAMGVGALSLIGLSAYKFAPLISHGATSGAKALGFKIAGGTLAAAGLVFAVPMAAHADVAPDMPFYVYDKEDGKKATVPNAILLDRSGIATSLAPPTVTDLTDKADMVKSHRTGTGYAPASAAERAKDPALPETGRPNYVVIGATGDGKTKIEGDGPAADSFVGEFSDKGKNHSFNYVIDRKGNVAMYVDPHERAMHTAATGMENEEIGWNSASVGIALVNDNTGATPYTAEQLEALRSLTADMSRQFDIPASHVLMQRQIADTP